MNRSDLRNGMAVSINATVVEVHQWVGTAVVKTSAGNELNVRIADLEEVTE